MTGTSGAQKGRNKTDILGLAGFGAFLIIVGSTFAATPSLVDEVREMILDLRLEEVYPGIFFPTPQSGFLIVYNALLQICIGMFAVSVAILAIRLFARQPIKMGAESLGDLVFWACVAVIASMMVAGSANVLMVLGYFLASIGASMVVRSAIVLGYSRLFGR